MGLGDKVRQTISDALNDATARVRDSVTGLIFDAGIGVLKRLEAELGVVESPVIDQFLKESELPPEFRQILKDVKSPTSPGPAMIAIGLAFMIAWQVFQEGTRIWSKPFVQAISRRYVPEIPDPATIIHAEWRGLSGPIDRARALASMGYDPAWHSLIDASLRPLIAWNELRQLLLRNDITQDQFASSMATWGWSTTDITRLKKLHELIPGVSDLVRMAVREAFTPEIIDQYQLHADFPPDFAKYAARIGLTEHWARAYWASHWQLPSITQAFEMLHRGIITRDDIDTLLRVQDVMPYWRDKLTKISYRTLTRVDVRRMYSLGVLDRPGVKQSYKDIGYDDTNAERMTEFTVKYQTSSDRELTKSDILGAYKSGIISRDEALELIQELDYSEDEAEFLLAKQDAAVATGQRNLTVSNYKELHLRGVLDKLQTTAALAELGFEAGEIELLYQLWQPEITAKTRQPSLADLSDFCLMGIITLDTWRTEMSNLGYAEKYIAWYEQEMLAKAAK